MYAINSEPEVSLEGRLRIIHRLGTLISKLRKGIVYSLSIECSEIRLAELNLNIDPEYDPGIVNEVLKCPLNQSPST